MEWNNIKKLAKIVNAISMIFTINSCTSFLSNLNIPKKAKIDYIKIEGIVTHESYIPSYKSINLLNKNYDSRDAARSRESKYFFYFSTVYGDKKIEVYDDIFTNKEYIDNLIDPGKEIEFLVDKRDSNETYYYLSADDVIKFVKILY